MKSVPVNDHEVGILTSPLSIYSVVRTDRLSPGEKLLAFSGCLFWAAVYLALV